MYYIIDDEYEVFEGNTLQQVCQKANDEGYFGDVGGLDMGLKNNEVFVFKGSRIKVKRTDPVYEEVKPVVAKKPAAKKTGAKR